MKPILILVFLVGLLPAALSAGRVEDAVETVAASPNDRRLRGEIMGDLKSEMGDEQLARQLLDRLWTAELPRVQVSCLRMLLDLVPFPFDLLHTMIRAEDSSDRRASLLFLLHRGAKTAAEEDSVLWLAKASLKDVRPGLRRFGEARAYSEEGLRVCDVAYNVLGERLSLVAEFPPLNADNFGIADRDRLVSVLAEAPAVVAVTDPQAVDDSLPTGKRRYPSRSDLQAPGGEPEEGRDEWAKWLGGFLLLSAILFSLLRTRADKQRPL